jgi:hypothetical protein
MPLRQIKEYTADLAVQTDAKARETLRELLDGGMSTVQIQNKYGFNRGLIPYVLNGGHSPTVLEALGLPVFKMQEVVVCAVCGEIHTFHKLCVEDKRVQDRNRKCADLHEPEDLEIMDDIAVEFGYKNFTEMCRAMVANRKAGFRAGLEFFK